jgi:hypothetical protein
MTSSRYKPRSPLTQEEAIESITRRELRTVKEKFGVALVQDFGDATKLEECMWAMVWLFERRADRTFSDDQLDNFELGTVMNYFTEPPFTGDETEAGKAPGLRPTNSPNGALSPGLGQTSVTT